MQIINSVISVKNITNRQFWMEMMTGIMEETTFYIPLLYTDTQYMLFYQFIFIKWGNIYEFLILGKGFKIH